jgi:hypothetical protein
MKNYGLLELLIKKNLIMKKEINDWFMINFQMMINMVIIEFTNSWDQTFNVYCYHVQEFAIKTYNYHDHEFTIKTIAM